MGLYFKSQDVRSLIGTKSESNVITPVALTASYQTESGSNPTKSFTTGGYSRAVFSVFYTMGATETANSVELRIEHSSDNVNWTRIANDSTSGGTSTLTAREFTFVGANAALATISIFMDIGYKYMRVAAKETGVVTNFGTVFVESTLSGL